MATKPNQSKMQPMFSDNTRALFDNNPDLLPDANFLSVEEIYDQIITITSATTNLGNFGRYFSLEFCFAESDEKYTLNVGATQPVEVLERALKSGATPFEAKFIHKGRKVFLVRPDYEA